MAAAVEAKTLDAAPRRPRRSRAIGSWRRRVAAVALLAAALTAVLAFTYPYLFDDPLNEQDPRLPTPKLAAPATISLHESIVSTNSTSISSPPPPPPPRPPPHLSLSPPPSIRHLDSSGRSPNTSNARIRPSRREIAYWRMAAEEALKRAKKEMQEAPVISKDTELYSRLFYNVSLFRRSYELMEKVLKVYIYQDGPRPIFHTPELQGIYASEGWFMKLMEESKRFVTTDPSKAHLFYLPYSVRRLKEALYVPNSHNMKPLSVYLKDYVNSLASKYPFWNRTGGRDHFIVACHDWGPYITTQHDELCKNTIKALCNADASEGIFVRGKDVSLPETAIRVPKRPLKYVGGKPISQRPILAFYAGNMHGRVRPTLVKYWGDKDEDMKIYRRLPNRVSKQMSYVEHMRSSKFCICPMGYEVNSPRIVEAIYAECVPVIIADNFVLPFEEVLDWSAFSVVVAEHDVPKLKDILLRISVRRYTRMHTCVRMLQKHFLWHTKPLNVSVYNNLEAMLVDENIITIQKQHEVEQFDKGLSSFAVVGYGRAILQEELGLLANLSSVQ